MLLHLISRIVLVVLSLAILAMCVLGNVLVFATLVRYDTYERAPDLTAFYCLVHTYEYTLWNSRRLNTGSLTGAGDIVVASFKGPLGITAARGLLIVAITAIFVGIVLSVLLLVTQASWSRGGAFLVPREKGITIGAVVCVLVALVCEVVAIATGVISFASFNASDKAFYVAQTESVMRTWPPASTDTAAAEVEAAKQTVGSGSGMAILIPAIGLTALCAVILLVTPLMGVTLCCDKSKKDDDESGSSSDGGGKSRGTAKSLYEDDDGNSYNRSTSSRAGAYSERYEQFRSHKSAYFGSGSGGVGQSGPYRRSERSSGGSGESSGYYNEDSYTSSSSSSGSGGSSGSGSSSGSDSGSSSGSGSSSSSSSTSSGSGHSGGDHSD